MKRPDLKGHLLASYIAVVLRPHFPESRTAGSLTGWDGCRFWGRSCCPAVSERCCPCTNRIAHIVRIADPLRCMVRVRGRCEALLCPRPVHLPHDFILKPLYSQTWSFAHSAYSVSTRFLDTSSGPVEVSASWKNRHAQIQYSLARFSWER